ncbi:MAG: hypothetical protein ACI90M_004477, partial [Candidatus Azotimanducaceae bacterium]
DIGPSHHSVYSAETATNSLVTDESELANSRRNKLGRFSG